MTKAQFLKKIKSMKKECSQGLEKECLRLFDSGAINSSDYEDNYLLPKIIFHVALINESWQYKPLAREAKKEVANLKQF